MRLNKNILLACANYYIGRARQETVPWNKGACLEEINGLCQKANIHFVGVAGTFFFSQGENVFTMSLESFPVLIKKAKEKSK